MNKKKSSVVPLAIIFAVGVILISVYLSQAKRLQAYIEEINFVDELSEEEDMLNLIVEAKTLNFLIPVLEYAPIESDETLDQLEAEQNYTIITRSEYEQKAAELFTSDSPMMKGQIETTELIEDEFIAEDEQIDEIWPIDFGFFEIEPIAERTNDDGSKEIDIIATIWAKTIIQSGADKFETIFMVNKSIDRLTLDQVDGQWKMVYEDIVGDLHMAGDYNLERTFSSFDEALEYATSVMPRNVLADQQIDIDGLVEQGAF